MAHFAKLDENNKVIDVIVVSNDMMIGLDGKEKEENGINFLNSIIIIGKVVTTARFLGIYPTGQLMTMKWT